MISKEEIEKAKECLKETMQNTYAEGKATKLNNVLKYIEQLEHDKDIMQRALNMQTAGWNEGAKLFADKQKLIEKLEEDKETLKKENADGTLQDYVIKLLEILKGENQVIVK